MSATQDPPGDLSRSRLEQVVMAFEDAWQTGPRPAIEDFLPADGSARRAVLAELAAVDLQRRLIVGEPARVEQYLDRYAELADNPDAVLELVQVEFEHRRRGEPGLTPEDYCRRLPHFEAQLRRWLAGCSTLPPQGRPRPDSNAPRPPAGAEMPSRLGRYRVTGKLGSGGFGAVYRGHDDELRRDVAIKVPHRERIARSEDAEAYLAEARILASLDHPHIVPVFDLGRSEDGLCFVVSKFVEGSDLARRLAVAPLSVKEAAELVATVAEALHHAHRRGLVHRDVKPGNILIDLAGKPYVADFGLALKEEDYGQGGGLCGTPAYMSPEQANGEGHRVDGRSDVFSLGVVFYELLTGRRPFRGDTTAVLAQIVAEEPRPPQQIDDGIPRELERICLKALAKRASDRYTTARDLADDLRHFLAREGESLVAAGPRAAPAPDASRAARADSASGAAGGAPGAAPAPPSSDSRPLRVVPKGLRSFDAHDADFFLELLPGPRDREGLPDSIRFWKTRIEETEPDQTFSVGLVYGPSGCGKSSLVKAGLLPRLSGEVVAVYVEATAADTETCLLNGLRKRCPGLPDGLALKEALAALRRGQGVPHGKKVLIVLDQFEQWLHARKDESGTELVQALRQCDGGRLQGLVLVRDDFWLAVSRFLRELEVRLVEGQNSALVDLFDPDHAGKVLTAFGRAFGKLPEGALPAEAKEFVRQAVAGLAQEGKVICVRLALFAEMMKGKPWSPATLREVGGAEGVGVTFLEETFSASTAPPEHRYHQKAARAVLKALLPESGTDIKGHMRSHAELLRASGYASRPREFEELMLILDGALRLITPTDPEGAATDGDLIVPESRLQPVRLPAKPAEAGTPSYTGEKFYQLTHDYLVHSLRDWLTRKQRQTRKGRAELRLAERSAHWNARPESRRLPAWWEWANMRLYTRRADWTPPQRTMMRRAGRFHLGRLVLLACLAALAGWGAFEVHGRLRAEAKVQALAAADISGVPGLIDELRPYGRWAGPLLTARAAAAAPESAERLRLGLALLPTDPGQAEFLAGRLLDARPDEVLVIRQLLTPHGPALAPRFWTVLGDPRAEGDRRLRAACALAVYDPDNPRWAEVRADVVRQLAAENPLLAGKWTEALHPVRRQLVGLAVERFLASESAAAPSLLLVFQAYREDALDLLDKEVQAEPKASLVGERPVLTEAEKDQQAKRRAQAAVALLHLRQAEPVWPLLAQHPDPRLRAFLVERMAAQAVEARTLLERLEAEPDPVVRSGILLALGEYKAEQLSEEMRGQALPGLLKRYREDADSGVHSALDWLLRRWGKGALVKEVKAEPGKVRKGGAHWYVNGQGQTLAVVAQPEPFDMGEGPTQRRRIPRSFAMATKEVTVEEFQRFRKDWVVTQLAPTPDCPVNGVSWYDAAAYCNWLSEREGIPPDQWCYVPWFGERLAPAPGYLERTGYRLPTEAEWEYTCRAGSVTPWSCGTEELLDRYAWSYGNSHGKMHSVGTLKPNALGLFDMHGNAWEWCHDRQQIYPEVVKDRPTEDREDRADSAVPAAGRLLPCGFGQAGSLGATAWLTLEFTYGKPGWWNGQEYRVLRSSAYNATARFLRSAYHYGDTPANRFEYGLRVARTYR